MQNLYNRISSLRCRNDLPTILETGGVGVELGVSRGEFSATILAKSSLSYLYSIDMYEGDRGHDVAQYRLALTTLMPHRARNSILRMRFSEAVSLFPDEYFDFIFVDGYAHTGEESGQTFRDWFPKLKKGGIFAGHDYCPEWPLVVAEVDRFVADYGLRLHVVDEIRGPPGASDFPTWITVKP